MSAVPHVKPWTVRLARPDDDRWVVERHRRIYRDERGWDARFESLVAGVVEEFRRDADAARERGWIAELDGRRVGCVYSLRCSLRFVHWRST